MQELITVKDAAAKLAVSTNTIYRMVKMGRLRRRSVGTGTKSFRILAEDVQNIIHPPQPRSYVPGSLKRRLTGAS